MMRFAQFLLIAIFALPVATIAQDLPPGVLLLSRVKRHIKEELQRLPNISCLETIEREHQAAGPGAKLLPMDTVRLEVLTDGEKELYASPGDRKFAEGHPIGYVGSGTLGSGYFGLYLKSVLINGAANLEYKGDESKGGRSLARYDWVLPVMWSGQNIHLPEGAGTVGLHGSFWADPETYDVVRLEMSADGFPPSLPLTEVVTSINYARTDLGNNVTMLLPASSDFRMVRFSGEVSRNRTTFTSCRIFEAKSKINFDAPDSVEATPRIGVSSVDDTLRPLPADLRIAVKLRSRIAGDAAVGSLIEGVVAGNVRSMGKVVIATGSPVRGRIRRLERYTVPSAHFVISIEFTEVELHGIRHRFLADLVSLDSNDRVSQSLATAKPPEVRTAANGGGASWRSWETLSIPKASGQAAFFFKGTKLDLRPGFETVWKTRAAANQ